MRVVAVAFAVAALAILGSADQTPLTWAHVAGAAACGWIAFTAGRVAFAQEVEA